MDIKSKYDVHQIGHAGKDAKVFYTKDKRPICKFTLAVAAWAKGLPKDQQPKPWWFNIVCFGDEAIHVKKGTIVELFGYVKKSSWVDAKGETHEQDEVIVKTDEKKVAQINYPGHPHQTKHVSDEEIAASVGKSLEITEEDCPFD